MLISAALTEPLPSLSSVEKTLSASDVEPPAEVANASSSDFEIEPFESLSIAETASSPIEPPGGGPGGGPIIDASESSLAKDESSSCEIDPLLSLSMAAKSCSSGEVDDVPLDTPEIALAVDEVALSLDVEDEPACRPRRNDSSSIESRLVSELDVLLSESEVDVVVEEVADVVDVAVESLVEVACWVVEAAIVFRSCQRLELDELAMLETDIWVSEKLPRRRSAASAPKSRSRWPR